MNCIIVDDEFPAIKELEYFIKNFSTIKIENTFESSIEALEYIQEKSVDVIFLDIHMPKLDGMSFSRVIKTLKIKKSQSTDEAISRILFLACARYRSFISSFFRRNCAINPKPFRSRGVRRAISSFLFDLAPDGVCLAPGISAGAVVSYTTLSPLFHVTLRRRGTV